MVWIASLALKDIRVMADAEIEPIKGLNFICGPNGAGKTSVLESIYLAGRGRSFRHPDAGPLVRRDAHSARVVLKLWDENGDRVRVLGVERARSEMRCRFDGREVAKRSQLAEALPIQFISSQPQLLLGMGPDVRRRFLDLALFHVEHRFLAVYSRVQKSLRQRNAALKQGQAEQVSAWDQSFVEAGNDLTTMRKQVSADVFDRAQRILLGWGLDLGVAYRYRQGWRKEMTLAEALSTRLSEDMERGFTGVGPQRADIEFLSDNGLAEKRLSRGQQKMFVIALNLAISDMVADLSNGVCRPVFLIDDLAAELDGQNLAKVLAALGERDVQVFVALIDPPAPGTVEILPAKVFHVEHGTIK
ncbi:MAG: DNA replication and repair protein RecF [Gammaproteobacteria bacterium]|nr:DNA replication and repair protein RecF [Gammaproteobacteria bacterium]